jgi:hypothetical protein
MGQTTFATASHLVAKGYANLTSVATGTAQICYMPDPVCAPLDNAPNGFDVRARAVQRERKEMVG